jgi:polyhydroxyalkanoate synthesis regulator phasin
MEDTMKETLKNILYTGIGIAFLTKEKVEELKADLIEKGKMSQEEGRLFVDDLLRRSEKARDQLDLWINKRVEERIAQFDLATRDELADLRRQVEELQVALNRESGEPPHVQHPQAGGDRPHLPPPQPLSPHPAGPVQVRLQ